MIKSAIILLISWLLAVCLWLWNIPPSFFAPLIPELILIGFVTFLLPNPLAIHKKLLGVSTNLKIAIAILIILFFSSILRSLHEWTAISQQHPLCLEMPGIFQRLECIFAAAADQNYALRQAATLLVAMYLFASMTVISKKEVVLIMRAIQLSGVSFALASYAAHFGYITIPGGWFDPAFADRFCYFIGNPSWIAPLLLPSLLVTSVFIAKQDKHRRLNLLSILPMLDIILRSQQRGGLVIVIICAIFISALMAQNLISTAYRYCRNYSKAVLVLIACLTATLIFVGPIIWINLTKLLKIAGFGHRLANSKFVSNERILIWKAALNELEGRFLIGHGYGTWYRAGASQVPKYGHHAYYDTAHNFFVQYLFEHGAISLGLWLVAVGLIALELWRITTLNSRSALIAIPVLFMPILIFQEIDFLRSIFYLSMISIGATIRINAGPSRNSYNPDNSSLWRASRAVIATTAIATACILTNAFSLAGYQYEANAIHDYGPKVRWFRQSGRVNFVSQKAANSNQYALYPIQKSNGRTLTIQSDKDRPPTEIPLISSIPTKRIFLPIRARSIFESADYFALDKSKQNDGRQLGFMVSWPPILSTLPLTAISGAEAINTNRPDDPAIKGLICSGRCEFNLIACPADRKRKFLLTKTDRMNASIDLIVETDFAPPTEISISDHESPVGVWANTNIRLRQNMGNTRNHPMPMEVFVTGGVCE